MFRDADRGDQQGGLDRRAEGRAGAGGHEGRRTCSATTNIMRKEDHQLLSPYYEAVFTKASKYDAENTGLGWKTEFED